MVKKRHITDHSSPMVFVINTLSCYLTGPMIKVSFPVNQRYAKHYLKVG